MKIISPVHEFWHTAALGHLQFLCEPGVQACSWQEEASELNSFRIRSSPMEEWWKELTVNQKVVLLSMQVPLVPAERGTKITEQGAHRHCCSRRVHGLIFSSSFSLSDSPNRCWTSCCDCTHLSNSLTCALRKFRMLLQNHTKNLWAKYQPF